MELHWTQALAAVLHTGVAPVQATFRPNAQCGRINIARYAPTVALEAMSGYVIFSSIYRGDPNADATLRATEVTQFSIELRVNPATEYQPLRFVITRHATKQWATH